MTDQIGTSSSSALIAAAPQLKSNGNRRIVWPGGPAKKQQFSLPDNIIYYMIQNPSSPELFLKLAMSCKYFFEKQPLLIVKRIHYGKFCSSKDWEECNKKNGNCCIEIDLAKLCSKIWLSHQYYFTDASLINALFPQRLYKCENALFQAFCDQIAFENYKFVALSFEKFDLSEIEMVDKDGNIVKLEEILGSLPNVKEFQYEFSTEAPDATALTMKKICKLDNLGSLQILRLDYIPEVCDVKDIEEFIMKYKDTKIQLRFRYAVSDEYKAQLDALCDTVIAAETSNCIIEYHDQDEKTLAVMRERYFK